MSNLSVFERDGILVVDSRLIAEDLGIEHRALLQTLEKYLNQIQEAFGAVAFEMQEFRTKQGNRSTERIAYLTEEQATLLMTFSRNTERVVRCKVTLVKAFSEARRLIKEATQTTQSTEADPLIVQLQALIEVRQAQLETDRRLSETDRRLSETDRRVAALEQVRADAHRELIALPPAIHEVPAESLDMKVRRVVNNYCLATGLQQCEVFQNLYQQHYYRYRRRVNTIERESKLQAFVRLGMIQSLYDLAVELFASQQSA